MSDSFSTEVHKSRRLKKDELFAFVADFYCVAMSTLTEFKVFALCKLIQDEKADVVSVVVILRTRISKADDEVFHVLRIKLKGKSRHEPAFDN